MKRYLRWLLLITELSLISLMLLARNRKSSTMFTANVVEKVMQGVRTIHHTTPKQSSQPCELIPKNLNSSVSVPEVLQDFTNNKSDAHRRLLPGGEYKPSNCTSQESTAIVVAYRDRKEHLTKFLQYMHRFLQKQYLHYMIFIVELTQPTTFNRGLLLNIGFVEAAKKRDFTCYVFHDVDLMPTNENNLYRCNDTIRHLCTASSKFKYKLPSPGYFGGVTAFPPREFRKVNGHSNIFFGWGGEDTDLGLRVKWANLTATRPINAIGKYWAVPHGKDRGNPRNPQRYQLLAKGKQRWTIDGLNSLQYELVQYEQLPTHTWIHVGVNRTELEKYKHKK